jgi:hypothetical protein
MTTANDVKAMFYEILTKISDGNTRMANLEDKVACLSTEVSSSKADQSHLLIAIKNIQWAISSTTSLLSKIMRHATPSRSTLTTTLKSTTCTL